MAKKVSAASSFAVFVVLASLDNAAAGVLPPLYAIIARDLSVSEAQLGFVTAVYILVVALSATFWGYRSDQGARKGLLLYSTLVWGVAMVGSGLARNLTQFWLFQVATAVGVGGVGAIGFSLVSDLIPTHRRGLALSLWSISQLLGGALGALLASTVGATHWRWPFFIIAGAGFTFAFLYLFTQPPQRGQSEPELAHLMATGQPYQPRIRRQDLPAILRRRSNRWLLTQRLCLTLALGSTIWVPRWAIARVQAEGHSLETATVVGNLFIMLFNVGSFLAIPAGHLGDRWQRRNPQGRTTLATIGLLGSIPFFVLLYFLPLGNIAIPSDANLPALVSAVFLSLFTNGWVLLAFAVAFVAVGLSAAEPPNWAALILSVNPPEHRGTVIGFSRLAGAIGNAISVSLTGLVIAWLTAVGPTADYPTPTNYAIGLALFQLLAVPAGLCYLAARHSIPADSAAVQAHLRSQAEAEW